MKLPDLSLEWWTALVFLGVVLLSELIELLLVLSRPAKRRSS
jgi:hypothetical protein